MTLLSIIAFSKDMSLLVKVFVLINVAIFLYFILMGNLVDVVKTAPDGPRNKSRYILDWARHLPDFLNYCPIYPNCFITRNRNLLPDLRDYDAILFPIFTLWWKSFGKLPDSRSQNQIYIFLTKEPKTPICSTSFDRFFNWTWTYRLDSDILCSYYIVNDLVGNMVAPKLTVNWSSTYQPIHDDLRRKFMTKRKAAAWFVSNCKTPSKREDFVKDLSKYMEQYNMKLDIYGKCGTKCSENGYCNKMIETDYYFYFAFENSIHKDYVTEKVLTAVNNLAVPVVYGGADYSRFLPPGSYLDARKLGAELLASTMRDIIQNRTRYEDMFRWRNHYRFKQNFMTNMCDVCSKLSDSTEPTRVFTYNNFRDWWNVNSELCVHHGTL